MAVLQSDLHIRTRVSQANSQHTRRVKREAEKMKSRHRTIEHICRGNINNPASDMKRIRGNVETEHWVFRSCHHIAPAPCLHTVHCPEVLACYLLVLLFIALIVIHAGCCSGVILAFYGPLRSELSRGLCTLSGLSFWQRETNHHWWRIRNVHNTKVPTISTISTKQRGVDGYDAGIRDIKTNKRKIRERFYAPAGVEYIQWSMVIDSHVHFFIMKRSYQSRNVPNAVRPFAGLVDIFFLCQISLW